MVDDQWIADACAEAHRLRHSSEGALILQQVERQVLGCGACGAAVSLGRVYCSRPCALSGRNRARAAGVCSVAGCERRRHLRRVCRRHLREMRGAA